MAGSFDLRRPVLLFLVMSLLPAAVLAGAPRVLPEGTKPADRRLEPPKDLDGYFPFEVPKSKEAWQTRREELRRQLLVANGLWPMPPRPPVEAVLHGTVDRDDFTVTRVYFETAPGFFVTGSLFRPKQGNGPFPTILCPHGHWADGRFYKASEGEVKSSLATGAESSEVGALYPLQARCVHLARMGCIVFHYDMIGYADSAPLTFDVAHRFAKQRPELSSPDKWGMFSAQSELRLINVLGLQTWNSIRALDWLSALPEVDTKRIGVTGASGGGTQTFLLSAVDERPAAAFPAVMVSTAMQGGCTCENASYLRVGTGNIEIAAMTAPRPLGMTAANDWTREIETKGLPELKRLYAMFDVPDRVEGKYFDFGHNYNAVSRRMMYEFFKRHFDLQGSIDERDFKPLSREELTVWNEEHPKPAMDETAELAVLRGLDERSNKQIAALAPTSAESLAEYRKVIGGAYAAMIGRSLGNLQELTAETRGQSSVGSYDQILATLKNEKHGEEIPTVLLRPHNWNRKAVLWLHRDGKAGLFDEAGDPIAPIRKLLDAGYAVATADLIGQGEFAADGKPLAQSVVVSNPREFAGYTLGYNHPLFAQRVHDILTLVAFSRSHNVEELTLIGFDEAAAWSAAAAARSEGEVDRLALGTGGFRFANITEFRDPNLLPGAVKYGDLPGLLALAAPTPMALLGEGEQAPELVRAAYAAAGKSDSLTVPAGNDAAALVDWVIGKK